MADTPPDIPLPKYVLDSLTPAPDPTGDGQAASFSAEDTARVETIRASQTWHFLESGIRGARESLLCSRPRSTEDLWQTWGRILQLSDLLHGGPLLVLEYSKMAERRRDQQMAQPDGEVSSVMVHTYKGE